MQKIIILTFNYEPSNFPKEPDENNRFYTYGFGSKLGKIICDHLQGYEVEVWRLDSYCKGKIHEKRLGDITYRVFHSKLLGKFLHLSGSYFKAMKNAEVKYDPVFIIVHTHNWHTYQILMTLKNAKIITTHHGEWSPFFVYENSSGLRKLKALIDMFIEKLLFKKIGFFLVTDHRQISYIKKSVKNPIWMMFSGGLDVNLFKPYPRSKARMELGLEENRRYILYVGKLYKYKQVDKLIEIWKDIKLKMPEVELLIAGNEPANRWGEEYHDLAVKSGVKLFGRVPNTELYKFYSASDVYVLLALREDFFGGTGIAPLESLACNTPVVSYSMRNYLGDNLHELGECPSTIQEYKDAIIKVLNKPDNYKNMRESIIQYYSYDKVAERIETAIKKLNMR